MMPLGPRTRLAVLLTFRGLVAFPFLGALAGGLIAFIAFSFEPSFDFDAFTMLFMVGSMFGTVPGLVFGVMIVWPTREERLWRVALYTVTGTVLLGVVGFRLGGEWIPQVLTGVYFFLPSSIGFWFGFILLYIRQAQRRDSHKRVPDL